MIDAQLIHRERERLALGLDALHSKWTPHPAQITIGHDLLYGGIKDLFGQCGRNFGKTELMSYLLWRWAYTFPQSENYYFAPYMKQAREILWASKRLQHFGPFEWVQSFNNTEMRIEFNNGSFIKLDGSDNVEAYRGIKPKGLTVYDEFKDFRPEFHDAYDPNRAAFNSPLFIIGTPPEFENHYTQLAAAFKADPTKRFYRFPTSSNPHIDRKWLESKKAELYAKGEADKWEREYEARFVKGGASRIFPMLSETHIKPHDAIVSTIRRDRKKLEWIAFADPAGASCFAVLFAALNPYTRTLYLLNEVYETSQESMSVGKIGSRILSNASELYDEKQSWRFGYDEAATWFANEMLDHFSLHFEPSRKSKQEKMVGLSLIKDMILQGKLVISSRCQKLFWEMDNYRKDDSGKIPKINDHLIDCLRYILIALNYNLNESEEIIPENDPMWRGARIEDDFPGFSETGEPLEDWELMSW